MLLSPPTPSDPAPVPGKTVKERYNSGVEFCTARGLRVVPRADTSKSEDQNCYNGDGAGFGTIRLENAAFDARPTALLTAVLTAVMAVVAGGRPRSFGAVAVAVLLCASMAAPVRATPTQQELKTIATDIGTDIQE